MKKLLFFSFFAILCFGYSAEAKKLKALLSYSNFYTSAKGPYVETYLSVVGHSVVFAKNASGKFQGSIEVNMIFKQGADIKFADKYNLLSQEVDDTSQLNFNFLDQQRIPLADGNYTFELSIADKNSSDQPFKSSQTINVSFPKDKINISGIELLESYKKAENTSQISKNGFDLVPFVNNFYQNSDNTLRFYAEVYNTKNLLNDQLFLISCYLEDYDTKAPLEKFNVFSKQQPKEVNVVMSEFNIKSLPSGNYNVVIEIRNNKNDLLALQQTFFQRSSDLEVAFPVNLDNADITNTFVASLNDSAKLRECIYSFRPVSNASENNFEDFQLKSASLLTMQRYTYSFWKSRNATDPESAFKSYMNQVELVNSSYKTPIYKGYETDRGRVYLQYGEPNEIVKEDREPSSYPYEIWHYYKIKNQSNRKFIFYNTDLVTNDFRLLHSDMAGEPNEPQWQAMLHKRDTQTRDYEQTKTKQGSFGDHTDSFGDRQGDNNINHPH